MSNTAEQAENEIAEKDLKSQKKAERTKAQTEQAKKDGTAEKVKAEAQARADKMKADIYAKAEQEYQSKVKNIDKIIERRDELMVQKKGINPSRIKTQVWKEFRGMTMSEFDAIFYSGLEVEANR